MPRWDAEDRTVMHRLFLIALALCLWPFPAAAGEPLPRWPCGPGETPYPGYAEPGAPPAVEIWSEVELTGDPVCLGRLRGRMTVVVALSARFRFAGTLDDLAVRAGAISRTAGLKYWSTNEQKWRILISEAAAVPGPDSNWQSDRLRRANFTAAEVRSGETLWFRQNDTRSIGPNLYGMRALLSQPSRLILETVNESPITFAFIQLFGEHELLSLHAVEHLGGDLWGYYGLAAVREEPVEDYARSLVNRTAAFFNFLQGLPGDAAPPLAR